MHLGYEWAIASMDYFAPAFVILIRADAFRQLYERGDSDALLDSLHDLEADPLMRGWLVEYLRMELGRA